MKVEFNGVSYDFLLAEMDNELGEVDKIQIFAKGVNCDYLPNDLIIKIHSNGVLHIPLFSNSDKQQFFNELYKRLLEEHYLVKSIR